MGASNYNQSWINFSDWDSANQTCNGNGWGWGNWGNWGNGGNCTPNQHSTWNGCVTDRDQNYDIQSTAPVTSNPSTLFVAEQYNACPVQLMPLSYDWTARRPESRSTPCK